MFTIIISAIHILVSIFLILVILLQTGKGQDLGAMFGGGGANTVFGSSGAGGFLTKLTTAGAVVFMLTCMVLAYLSGTTDSAVLRELEETTTAPAPIDEAPVDEAPLAEDAAPAAGADEAAPAANEADAAAPEAGAETAPAAEPAAAPAAAPAPTEGTTE